MSKQLEALTIGHNVDHLPHSWHHAYISALRESDPHKLLGRIEYAISAIERRYAQWGTDPGSAAELTAIKKCISTLRRLMKEVNQEFELPDRSSRTALSSGRTAPP